MSAQALPPTDPSHDPMPQAPEPPDINACCGSGCDPCIFDAHDMAMDAYRQALRAWQARQAARETAPGADA
jgi:hypothetical protein